MRGVKALAAVASIIIALQTSMSFAQVPPTRFFGELWINGHLAPAGTEIKVTIGDVDCGLSVTMEDGRYVVDAAHAATVEGCGVDESEVVFYINGVMASERGTFTEGTFKELHLSIDGGGGVPPAEPHPEEPPAEDPPAEDPPADDDPPAEPEDPEEFPEEFDE